MSRRQLDLGMWFMVPGRDNLARLYCEGCEHYSRPVRTPTAAEQATAFPIPMYPDPPKGWEHGCPRCDPTTRAAERKIHNHLFTACERESHR